MPAVVKDAESRAAGIRYERLPDERLRRYDGFVTTVTTVTTLQRFSYNGSNSYNGYERSREHATLDTLQEAGSRAESPAVTSFSTVSPAWSSRAVAAFASGPTF